MYYTHYTPPRLSIEATRLSINHCPCPSALTQTRPSPYSPPQELVDDAVRHGAQVLVGGKPNPAHTEGNFYLPTVLVGVTNEMKIAQEEVFGPVMTIIKVRGWLALPNNVSDAALA